MFGSIGPSETATAIGIKSTSWTACASCPACAESACQVRDLLPEAVWQRCHVRFLRNALDYLPRRPRTTARQELRWLIPMARGFAYLVAIIDWSSRRVLAWRPSNTQDTGFCIEALRDALAHFGRPTIFNTDRARSSRRGTSPACCATGDQDQHGKGRCLDNIFVERLWRSLKYEEIYLHPL